MKRWSIAMLLFAFALTIKAQSLTPSVIASTGGFSSNANGSLSYTVGEMTMVQTFSANGNVLTQGFQQPNDNLTGFLDLVEDAFGSFIVYPNPAVDDLWYGFQFPEAGKVSIAVYNALGQKIADVFTGDYENGKTIAGLPVTNMAVGSYYMSLVFTAANTSQIHLTTKSFQVIR